MINPGYPVTTKLTLLPPGHSVSNHPKKMKFKTGPPPQILIKICTFGLRGQKKSCPLLAFLVKYFPRYGSLKFC